MGNHFTVKRVNWRTCVTVGALVLILLETCLEVSGQDQVFSILWYYSMTYPEQFDQYLAANAHIFNKQFFTRLVRLRLEAGVDGSNQERFCSPLPYDQAAECRLSNWSLSVYLWTLSIEDVVRGEYGWLETMSGVAAYQGNQLCEFYDQMLTGLGDFCWETSERVNTTIAAMHAEF